MMLLWFVLDLRSLSPPVLRDLKQSLLQLANYYAVSCRKINNSSDSVHSTSKPLLDCIGLCYVLRNRTSCSDELKIAYAPHGNFNLRDLHHALNNLPTDAFLPEYSNSVCIYKDLKLADVLSAKTIYAWGDHDKNVARKVIFISSCLVDTLDSVTMKALTDAVDKRISMEFILLEQTSSYLGDFTENINHLVKQIGSLKNCSFQTCVPNQQVLHGFAKRWFQELKDDKEEPLQAHFIFKTNLISTLNQISCNLCTSFNPIVDEFIFCQTCRCHGIPLDNANVNETKRSSSCPVTNDDLGALDIIENSVRVGEQTTLYMPSFRGSPKLKQVSSRINFIVIQRTNLGSLSEGLIMGPTYFVTPSTLHDSDENDKSEQNNQLFQAVCSVLNSLDQGLVCSSNCNIETAMEISFRCYYILLPSDKGLMLLRRLSASEEFLPIPDVSQFISSIAVEEIENTVQASLLKLGVSDYNPIQHDRGLHQKLNLLVKESLQFGAILPKSKEVISSSNSNLRSPEAQPPIQAAGTVVIPVDELSHFDPKPEEKKAGPCLTEEWEQLVVTELKGIHSPTCISNLKLDQVVMSPSQSNRQVDEKTSRILERLELPRQLKRKAVSPTMSITLSAPAKKPLIPYKSTDTADQGPILSQPIKPNFQRIKKGRDSKTNHMR
ncbi:uncharacterized protein LOC105165470 isoform X1 [Sesamum indicum]|uniref:Uncharacterized protein LOC105165470 isoform X1 n=1 Tax=Sesamum indicum TaxID=4182 RepID=A0A6I9TD06_SESIN|nr:uncharacterized protein LOC105165470 isoform X1 [Sesamum indicum]